jgi:phytanoyl-CoA hydroxylase
VTPADAVYAERVLSLDQIDHYHRDGYLAIEDFATPAACAALKRRADEIVAAFEPSELRTVFTTDQQVRNSNREFLESAGGIWCFFEEEAFGPDGELVQDKALCINKIGHAMHDLDPVFEEFSYTPELAAVAEDLGFVDALALQSMYIFKQPRIGGEVGCHQDATFLFTDPITVTGFWFAIEDATIENGCLWVEAGGHHGPLRQQFQRAGESADEGTKFVRLDDTPLPTPPEGLTPVVVPAGTMVVLHGLLPHWSDVNRSPVSRHAYSLHCIEAGAEYPAWNWLQRPPDMPLRSLSQTAASVHAARTGG